MRLQKSMRGPLIAWLSIPALILLFVCVAAIAGDQPQPVQLQPRGSFTVAGAVSRPPWNRVLVRDMRAGGGSLWFLVNSKEESNRVAIIATDVNGRLRRLIDLPGLRTSGGLALSSRGVAVITHRSAKDHFVSEFDANGEMLRNVPIDCYSSGGLITVDDTVLTVCPDGTLVDHDEEGSRRPKPSWVRPTTIPVVLSSDELAVVDQSTGQVLLNNIRTNGISVLSIDAPEIVIARQKVQAAWEAAERTRQPEVPPMGRPIIIPDCSVDSSAFYLLVWPYNRALGPAVVKIDKTGRVMARYLCLLPGSAGSSFPRLAILDGRILLASTAGDVLWYKQ